MAEYSKIILEEIAYGAIALSFNDPERRNAMSEEMATEFSSALKELSKDESLRLLVIRGEGQAFSSGGDLDMLEAKTRQGKEENEKIMLKFYNSFLAVRELNVPVIAALNGHAVGAGLCLALACDIRVGKDGSKFGLNFVRLGLHPGMGVTYFLPRLIGSAFAAELLFRGMLLSAEEAYSIGLINHFYAADDFENELGLLIEDILSAGPESLRQLKQTLRDYSEEDLASVLSREAKCQAINYASSEFVEGILAARGKRRPRFR